MISKIFYSFLSFLFLVPVSSWAIDPPAPVANAFSSKYHAVQPTWEKATGMYLAAFVKNGQKIKAAFKEDGTFMREDNVLPFSQLPQQVRMDASQRFGESNIVESASYTDAFGQTGYRIRYQKGNTRVDVMYNAQNVISQRAILE